MKKRGWVGVPVGFDCRHYVHLGYYHERLRKHLGEVGGDPYEHILGAQSYANGFIFIPQNVISCVRWTDQERFLQTLTVLGIPHP